MEKEFLKKSLESALRWDKNCLIIEDGEWLFVESTDQSIISGSVIESIIDVVRVCHASCFVDARVDEQGRSLARVAIF